MTDRPLAHDQDSIAYEEVGNAVASALQNCGYVDKESIGAAVDIVVQHARDAGVSLPELRTMIDRYTWVHYPGRSQP